MRAWHSTTFSPGLGTSDDTQLGSMNELDISAVMACQHVPVKEARVKGETQRLLTTTTVCPGRPPLCRDVASFLETSVVLLLLRGCPIRSSPGLRKARRRRRRRRPRLLAAGRKVSARGHLGLFARHDNLGFFFVGGRALERRTSRTRGPLPHVDVLIFRCGDRGGRVRFDTSRCRSLSCRCCCLASCPTRCDCAHGTCRSEVG